MVFFYFLTVSYNWGSLLLIFGRGRWMLKFWCWVWHKGSHPLLQRVAPLVPHVATMCSKCKQIAVILTFSTFTYWVWMLLHAWCQEHGLALGADCFVSSLIFTFNWCLPSYYKTAVLIVQKMVNTDMFLLLYSIKLWFSPVHLWRKKLLQF